MKQLINRTTTKNDKTPSGLMPKLLKFSMDGWLLLSFDMFIAIQNALEIS